MLTRAISRATLGSLAVAAVATGVAVASTSVTPAVGTYASSAKPLNGSGKGTVLGVVKKGSGRELKYLYLQCFVNRNNLGAVQAAKAIKVSKSGSFSYNGKAMILHDGTLAGHGTLKVRGKFVSATKARGTVKYSSKAKLKGCPASGSSFTVTKKK